MKKNIYLLLAAFAIGLASKAGERLPQQINGIWYEWANDAKTEVITASANFSIKVTTNTEPDQNVPWQPENWPPMKTVVKLALVDLDDPNNGTPKGPNASVNLGNIPEEFEFEGRKVKVVGLGEFSFAGGSFNELKLPSTIKRVEKGAFALGTLSENKMLVIPEPIEYIGEYAFADLKNINDMILPSTLKEIDDHAFELSYNFRNLTIPASVTRIGNSAFRDCKNMVSLYFEDDGEGSLTIGDSAFEGIGSLNIQPLRIPASVSSIGDSAFARCGINGLEFVDPENSQLKYLGNHAFDYCGAIKGTITLPDGLEFIGDYAFNMCRSLDGVVFGTHVRYIGDYAFYHIAQRNFNDMHFPGTLEHIGSRAFDLTRTAGTKTAWTDLYVHRRTPPEIHSGSKDEYGNWVCDAFESFGGFLNGVDFYNSDHLWVYPYICLHVPIGTREIYQTTHGWEHFTCIIDDLVDESTMTETSIGEIVGYAFTVPEEEINLVGDILQPSEVLEGAKWDKVDNDILKIDENGHVMAKGFGEYVAVARKDVGNTTGYFETDGGGYPVYENGKPKYVETPVGEQIVAVVVVYVCPTVILAYELDQQPSAAPKAPRALGAEEDVESSDNGTAKVTELATYEHRVVYNSYPQVKVEAAAGYEIGEMRHDKAEDDRSWNYDQVKNEDEYLVDPKNDMDDEVTIALSEPIVQNRVILLTIMPTADTDGPSIGTGIQDVQVSAKIRVQVSGNVVTVIGAEDSDVVTVTNIKGQTVSRSTDKTVVLDRGIFVINVADASLKIVVR